MKILAMDSTALTATVAVTDNGELLAEYTLRNGNTHSETLLPMVEHVLSSLGLSASDIDLFAVANGPGSFTGVADLCSHCRCGEYRRCLPFGKTALSRRCCTGKICRFRRSSGQRLCRHQMRCPWGSDFAAGRRDAPDPDFRQRSGILRCGGSF